MEKRNLQLIEISIAIVIFIALALVNNKSYNPMAWIPSHKVFSEMNQESDKDDLSEQNQSEISDKTEEEGSTASEDRVSDEEKSVKSGLSGSNYLVYAVDSNGALVKWHKSKIKVYVAQSEYNNTIRTALRDYNTIFEGYFEFIPSKRNGADITIEVVDNLEKLSNQSELYMAGLTNNIFVGKDKQLSSSTVKLLSVKPNSRTRVSNDEMYPVVMHELGHALGIIGHSQDESDVMYAFTTKNTGRLTQRDITTIKMMYSNDKEVIGRETSSFAQKKLEEAEQYVKMSPNKAISWISLGKVYFDVGRKGDALDAYKRALTIEPSNPNIYLSMAECYYSSEKYDTAIKYYNYALERASDTSSNPAIYNMMGLCYAHKDDAENAYLSFKQAFEYNTGNKSILHNLLTMCVELKKKQEAKDYISQYQQSGGDMEDDIIKKTLKWAR